MRLRIIPIAGLLCWLSAFANAQDPFAAPDANGLQNSELASEAKDTEPADDDNNPIIRAIRERATKGPQGLGDAIRKAMQLGRLDVAGALLQQLVSRDVPPADLAIIAETISDPRLFSLRISPRLSSAQKDVVAKLQNAAQQVAQDRPRLQKAVQELTSTDDVVRRSAEQIIARGGPVAVKALVSELVLPKSQVPLDILVHQLHRFEDDGINAVSRAALDGPKPGRFNALRALGMLHASSASRQILATAYDSSLTVQERQIATQQFADRQIVLPARETAIDWLANDLQQSITAWRLTLDAEDEVENLWLSGPELVTEFRMATRREAAATRSGMAAQRLLRCGALPPRIEALALAAMLGAQLAADPEFGIAPENLLKFADAYTFDEASVPGILEAALVEAQRADLPEAAVACIRMMSNTQQPELVASIGPQPRQLIAAMDDPSPAVRYEATSAAWRLAAGSNRDFVGSGSLARRVQELAKLASQPAVLLIEPRKAEAARMSVLLRNLGHEVRWLSTCSEALDDIDRNPDLEFVVMTSRPADAGPIELIDRIRQRPTGKRLPILVVGAAPWQREMGLQSRNQDSMTLWMPRSQSIEALRLAHQELLGNPNSRSFDSRAVVVEFRDEVAEQWVTWLRRMGYRVDRYRSALDAYSAIAQAKQIDLLVVDADLPDTNPIAFAKRVRNLSFAVVTPVLILGPNPGEPVIEVAIPETWDAPTRWVTHLDSTGAIADWRDRLLSRSYQYRLDPQGRDRLRASVQSVLRRP